MNVDFISNHHVAPGRSPLRLFYSNCEFLPERFVVEMRWEEVTLVPSEELAQTRFLSATLHLLHEPKITYQSFPDQSLSVVIETADSKIDLRIKPDGVVITVIVLRDAEAAVRFCENVASTGTRVQSRLQQVPGSAFSPFEPSASGYLFGRILKQQQTPYQLISLSEHPVYGQALLLGDELQIGADDEHLFSQGMVAHAMNEDVKKVLVLGGGDCGVLREVLTYPVERVVMVELDRDVVEFCRKHFPEIVGGAPEDPRVEMRFEDAFQYLKNCTEEFDVVLSDLPDTPIGNDTLDAQIALMDRVLAENGTFGTHAEFRKFGQPDENEPIVEAIAARFEVTKVIRKSIPSFQDQVWLFIAATH